MNNSEVLNNIKKLLLLFYVTIVANLFLCLIYTLNFNIMCMYRKIILLYRVECCSRFQAFTEFLE